jgi:hypothetical protein
MLKWWYFPSNTTLQFTGVFILSLAATCFGHLFGHLQAILESVYFLFTLLYLQYTYTYTTTATVIRDLLLCSMGKLIVMVALQVIGAGCCLLFICIRHYECADPLVFRLSVLLYILPLMCGVRYIWCFSLWTGADPSLRIRVGTFWGCRSCLLLPPGIGVVLVFYPVAGRVSSVLSCTCNVALSGGTGVELALPFTVPLLLRL